MEQSNQQKMVQAPPSPASETELKTSNVELREFYYTTGDHYSGYCLRGQNIPHGQGRTTSPGKFVYEGGYKNGRYHGFGKITFELSYLSMGNQLKSYEGGFRDGYSQGEGTAMYWVPAAAAKSPQCFFVRYIGGWSLGERDGHGSMIYFSGAQYDGGWKRGVAHGQGTFTWENGSYYDGGWKDGKRSGYGLLVSGDGSKYEGRWLDDNKY
jgi:hypothetical protein